MPLLEACPFSFFPPEIQYLSLLFSPPSHVSSLFLAGGSLVLIVFSLGNSHRRAVQSCKPPMSVSLFPITAMYRESTLTYSPLHCKHAVAPTHTPYCTRMTTVCVCVCVCVSGSKTVKTHPSICSYSMLTLQHCNDACHVPRGKMSLLTRTHTHTFSLKQSKKTQSEIGIHIKKVGSGN